MAELTIAFLGDIVGSVGRRAVAQAVPILRAERGVGVVIVNGENSRQGSGITPEHVRELKAAGVHAVTLGDHCYRDRGIIPMLEDPMSMVARPANLSPEAPGKRVVRVRTVGDEASGPPVYVVTVLGRMFMPIPSDNPFAAVDREVAAITEPGAMVIVEVHGEVTSEKQAMAWHCLERWTGAEGARVVAVVGSHTHVQTADARLLDHQLAAITDLGMCGPHRGVIGRSVRATLQAMVMQMPSPLDVASDEPRVNGVVIRVETKGRRPLGIEAVSMAVRG